MESHFPPFPESVLNDKKNQVEVDLEQYEKTVNAIHDTIRERIEIQKHILDDHQVQLRPKYDTPRISEEEHKEVMPLRPEHSQPSYQHNYSSSIIG
jgi:hypothetical protein